MTTLDARIQRHLDNCHAEYLRLLGAGKWPLRSVHDSTPDQDLLESKYRSQTI